MKKIFAFTTAAMMMLSLAACGNQTSNQGSTDDMPSTGETDAVIVNTKILKEEDPSMINTYTVIAVNPDAPFTDADGNAVDNVMINTDGAEALIQWFLSDEGLELAGAYGQEEYGDSLFYIRTVG